MSELAQTRLLLLLLLTFVAPAMHGQSDLRSVSLQVAPQFDTVRLQEYKNDPNYQYQQKAVRESWFSQIWRRIVERFKRAFDGRGTLGDNVFLLLMFAGLILIMSYFFMNAGFRKILSRRNRALGETIHILDEEVAVDTLSSRISNAEQHGDFRSAYRWLYIDLLHRLHRSQMISLHADKTNRDYKNEMHSSAIREDFLVIANAFDFFWYGEYPLTEPEYTTYRSVFQRLQSQMSER